MIHKVPGLTSTSNPSGSRKNGRCVSTPAKAQPAIVETAGITHMLRFFHLAAFVFLRETGSSGFEGVPKGHQPLPPIWSTYQNAHTHPRAQGPASLSMA